MLNKKYFVLVAFILFMLLAGCNKASQPAHPTLSLGNNTCTYSGPNSVHFGAFKLDIVQTEKDPLASGFALVTLQSGKTIADLQAWLSTTPPHWITDLDDQAMLTTTQSFSYDLTKMKWYHPYESLFLVCFQRDAKYIINKIGAFGPIAVTK
jgi:hypothetical protein